MCVCACVCDEFEYGYIPEVLVKLRVVGNPMYVVPKITTLGSYD